MSSPPINLLRLSGSRYRTELTGLLFPIALSQPTDDSVTPLWLPNEPSAGTGHAPIGWRMAGQATLLDYGLSRSHGGGLVHRGVECGDAGMSKGRERCPTMGRGEIR